MGTARRAVLWCRCVVPLRGIAEWMGAQVEFRAPRVSIRLGGRNVALTLGSSVATVNGARVHLSAPARSYDGVTCVPVRFVGEELGAGVASFGANRPHPGLSHDGPQMMADLAFVRVRYHQREARVVVHGLPPSQVAAIMRAWDRLGSRYGQDWISACLRRTGSVGAQSTCRCGWIVTDDGRGAFATDGPSPTVEWALEHGAWHEDRADWD